MTPQALALRRAQGEAEHHRSLARALAAVAGACVFCSVSVAARQATDAALTQLRNPDLRARIAALKTVRATRDPRFAPHVAPLIVDVEDEAQVAGIEAILELYAGTRVSSSRRVGLVVERRGGQSAERVFLDRSLLLAPGAVAPEVAGALARAIVDESARVRLLAVYAYGVLAPYAQVDAAITDRAGESLARVLNTDAPDMRLAAARVAGRVLRGCGAASHPPEACRLVGDALIGALNARDQAIELTSMNSLGELRYAPALQALTDRFTYYDSGLPAAVALGALAKIGHPSSAALFTTLVADRRDEARRLAAEGLGRIGDPARAPALQALVARDRSPRVKLAAACALEKLGPPGRSTRLADIVKSLTVSDLEPDAEACLVDLAPGVTAALLPFLQDPSPARRASVVEILGAIGGREALARLEPLTRDPDRTVAAAAARAIDRLRRTGVAP